MTNLLNVSSSPHVRSKLTTQKIMFRVIIALMPVTVLGILNYGISAFMVVLESVISAVLTEAVFNLITKRPQTIRDGSAVVTGILLALVLPPELPAYVPVIGSVFAILIVKCLFGGLGHNFMNPALAARCFLLISYGSVAAVYKIDGLAMATPLADYAAGKPVSLMTVFLGDASGVIGSSVLGILIGAALLFAWKIISFETPASLIVAFTAFMAIFGGNGFDVNYLLLQLMGGGVLLGAFFMVTDYVTSPVTSVGQLVYGAAIGVLCGLFRVFGSASDSVSYAIIIGNILVPLIDEHTVPVPYGYRKQKERTEKEGFSIPKAAVTLCAITLIAGAALSGVFSMTKDAIEEQKLAAQMESYRKVCPAATDFISDQELDAAVEALGGEVYGTAFGKVHINKAVVGKDASGETAGYVLGVTSGDGFDGDIVMSIGLDAEGVVTGIEFTEISETAGMGMKVTEAEFKDQFVSGTAVSAYVLNKAGGSENPGEIDSVSGASVSSGAVVNAVNAALDFFAANIK